MKIVTFTAHSNSFHNANNALVFSINTVVMLWSIDNGFPTSVICGAWLIFITYKWLTQVSYDIVVTDNHIELCRNKPTFERGVLVTNQALLASVSTTQKRLFRFRPLLNSGTMLMLDRSGQWVVILDKLSDKQVSNLQKVIGHSFAQIDPQQTSN